MTVDTPIGENLEETVTRIGESSEFDTHGFDLFAEGWVEDVGLDVPAIATGMISLTYERQGWNRSITKGL